MTKGKKYLFVNNIIYRKYFHNGKLYLHVYQKLDSSFQIGLTQTHTIKKSNPATLVSQMLTSYPNCYQDTHFVI